MNRNLLVILVFSFVWYRPAFSQSNSSIKIMAYNILDGYDRGKDQNRKQQTIAFLRDQNPDVIGFQELVGITADSLREYARSIGHEHSIILKETGYPVGLTSTRPIELKAKIHGDLWHGMLHVKTHGIDFFVLHLSPHSAEIRQREALTITRYMENNLIDQPHYIVLGDFNALSPFDAYFHESQPDLLQATRKGDDQRGKNKNLIDGRFDYSTMSQFMQYPLYDITRWFEPAENRFSIPTPLLAGSRLRAEEIHTHRRRIDYILVSRALAERTVSAQVVNSGVVDQLSDHYPVIAEIDH